MLKKRFKGFTLVELIIVMFILAILMSSIINMFKPIRETYVDATLYESQRTAQNGIITYVTESVRYATDMGIYNNGVTSAQGAVDEFATAFCKYYEITDAAKVALVKEEIKKKAEVIVISNSATKFAGKDCYGRLIRRKLDGTNVVTDAYSTSPDKARLALGEAYYGDETYSIGIDVTDKDNGVLAMTVASTSGYGTRSLTKSQKVDSVTDLSTLNLISVAGDVVCKNLTSATSGSINFGVQDPGMYDTDSYSGNSTTKGVNTYIVFFEGNIKSNLLAIANS